jgi:hypothetical protein
MQAVVVVAKVILALLVQVDLVEVETVLLGIM